MSKNGNTYPIKIAFLDEQWSERQGESEAGAKRAAKRWAIPGDASGNAAGITDSNAAGNAQRNAAGNGPRNGKREDKIREDTTLSKKGGSISTSAVPKPPGPSRPPLRAALQAGSADQVESITEDYGQELIKLTDEKKISAKMSLMAFEHYWPGNIDQTEHEKLEKLFAKMSGEDKWGALRSLSGSIAFGFKNGFDFKPESWKSAAEYAERTIFTDDDFIES